MHAKKANQHRVSIVVFPGVSLFELSAALEIFGSQDNTVLEDQSWYDLAICGLGGRGTSVTSDRGLRVEVTHGLRRIVTSDTVVVPPPRRMEDQSADLVAAVARAHQRGARVVSLCTGAFVLAAAGLLDGRRATTHWADCAELAARHPDVVVDPDVLYVDDEDILTSAGSAASIDLCLHIVRKDRGAQIAADLARELVVAPHRDGGQAQFIRRPFTEPRTDEPFTATLAWLQDNLAEPCTVDDLARRSAMSRRTFARRFHDSTGTTPHQWVLRQRVELAQRLLETTDDPVETIAAHSGFGTALNLRKNFARAVRTTPAAYRRTFAERSSDRRP